MMDEIELVDRSYEKCTVEKAPRQIKTRKLSFSSIKEKWTQFRIARMEKKLDKMKDDALNTGYTDKNFEKKIEKKATAIAKLEEKIMVLAKEDVPTNYVKRRAIKLRKKMSENLSYNSKNMYTVGLDKKDEIFALETPEEVLEQELTEEQRRIQEQIARNVSEIMNEKESANNVVSSEDVRDAVNESFAAMDADKGIQAEADKIVSSADVRDAVNESFDELSKDKVQPAATGEISGDDIRSTINEKFDELVGEKVKPQAEVAKEETGFQGTGASEIFGDLGTEVHSEGGIDVSTDISRDAVKDAINEAFGEVKAEEVTPVIPEVNDPFVESGQRSETVIPQNETVSGEVTLNKEEIEAAINEVIDRIKVSKNQASAVKFDKYNEDGTMRSKNDEYVYTPMTDEEIRASQEKLGFDEHGNLIDQKNNNSEVEEYTYTPMTDEEVKASQENLGFDENGNDLHAKVVESLIPDEYVYTPMTDEEIRASQEKLGFDERGNLVNPPKADYDIVATAKVVNDERSPLYAGEDSSLKDAPVDSPRTARTVEKDIDYSLEPESEQLEEFVETENVTGAESVSAKIDDYNSLKEKLLQLQKQQALTMQKKEKAQKEAEEAADAALKAKQEYEASEKSVSRSMEMLKAYTEALQEDCERNVNAAELAENDARINKNFIDEQKGKVDANNRLIDEIDSLIGPRAVPDSIKVR